jgi:hypothetical protein
MHKKRIILIVLILTLLLAVPVQAKGKERIGDPIDVLFGDPDTFIAGDPFHIAHGWITPLPAEAPMGKYSFELEVDGVVVAADFKEHNVSGKKPATLTVSWVHNFPEGLSEGTHEFTGYWYGPCQFYAADPTTCPNPNAKTLAYSTTLIVEFLP